MSEKKIEHLEKWVAFTVEVLNELQAEKLSLEGRLRELEKEKELILKENEKSKGALEQLKQLRVSHRKLEKDRSTVRLKVQNVLQKIEKMDFV